jgi:hypothetical protein
MKRLDSNMVCEIQALYSYLIERLTILRMETKQVCSFKFSGWVTISKPWCSDYFPKKLHYLFNPDVCQLTLKTKVDFHITACCISSINWIYLFSRSHSWLFINRYLRVRDTNWRIHTHTHTHTYIHIFQIFLIFPQESHARVQCQ